MASRTNSWICGIWLIVAGGALHHIASGTKWNNIIIGAVVLLVSLVPSKASRPPTLNAPVA
jgi:hypothetical protein